MLREISPNCRETIRGYATCRQALRDAIIATHNALCDVDAADLGDETSLSAIERQLDEQLKAFGALAAFDRGQEAQTPDIAAQLWTAQMENRA